MARTRILIDIRRHRGNSSFAVELVRCFCSRFSGATEEWLVRPDQAHLIPSASTFGTADEFDKSWGARLRDLLVQSQKAENATDGAFLVLSYDNRLLTEAKNAAVAGVPVTAIHISELFKMGVHKDGRIKQIDQSKSIETHFRSRSDGWAGPRSPGRSLFLNFTPRLSDPPLSISEAEQLAKMVLRSGGHLYPDAGLPQKDLRPKMAALDSRAVRRFGDPASEALITNLVDLGLQQGWLKRFRRIPERTGTETLYMVDDLPIATVPVNSAEESANQPAAGGPANALGSEAVLAATPRSGTPAEATASDSKPRKHANRATEFEAILSNSRIGAMPESREKLLEAVAAIITDNKGSALPLLELFRRAVALAQQASDRDGYLVEKHWPVVQLCIRRLMLWAGVLLDEKSEPILDKIGSNAKEVAALAPDFRRLCEAYLVEHIIEKAGGVNYDDDTYYLGLTVYRRGIERAVPADELKAKADSILAYLEDAGRIFLDEQRTLRVKRARGRSLAVAG